MQELIKQSAIALAVAVGAMSLTGCEEAVQTGSKWTTVEVVSVDFQSKTNSTVDLREVVSGYVWKDQYLRCYDREARKVKIGSKWDVLEIDYKKPKSERYFSRLNGVPAICEKSQ